MGINATAKYYITAEDKSEAAWKAALGHAEGFAGKMKGFLLPVASGAALASFAKETFDLALSTKDLSERMQVSVESASRMSNAFQNLGLSEDALEKGFRELRLAIDDASRGKAEAVSLFRELGVSAEYLRAQKPEEQILAIAEAYDKTSDPITRTRIAQELFSKAGPEWVAVLGEGSEKMREYMNAANEMSGRSVKSLDRANKAWDKFWREGKANFINVTGEMLAQVQSDTRTEQEKLEDWVANADRIRRQYGENSVAWKRLEPGYADASSRMQVYKDEAKAKQDLADQNARNADIEMKATELQEEWSKTRINTANALREEWEKAARATADYNDKVDQATEELRQEFANRNQDLINDSRTSAQKTADEWQAKEDRINEARQRGLISEQQQRAALSELNDEYLQEVEVKHFKMTEKNKEHVDEMTEYWKSAQRNMQSAFADFLYDPFKDGMDGMLRSFVDTLRRMAAEAAAAEIFSALFGKKDNDGNNKSGWISTGLSLLGSYFGGGKASGGPVSSNSMYLVGEQGPELFSPSSNGSIIPNHALGGSTSLSMPITINVKDGSPQSVAAIRNESRAMQERMQSVVLTMKKRGQI